MRNLNNIDIKELADEFDEEEGRYASPYSAFIAGFNTALEELQKEYTEIDAYIQNDLLSDSPQINGRFDILIKRKDLC